MKLRRRWFTFATHNMTEGPVTSVVAGADVVVGQEVDDERVKAGLAWPRFARFIPFRSTHQTIAWRRSQFRRDGKARAVLLHRSGQAEGWDGIRTPARFVLIQRLVHRKTGARITVLSVWLINSWQPASPRGRDRFTAQRYEIAEDSLETIERLVAHEQADGRLVVMGGDFNSIVADLEFDGLNEVPPRRGLDRIFAAKGLRVLGTSEGPTTGVGNDMRHHSRQARLQIL